jgi:hypothetical protein
MSDLASLIAQLSGSNQQPAADPATAVVKQARASIDALMLKLGQTIDAKVTGQLAAGLTQLAAGKESFVLKLATPLPTGAAVTIRVAATPQGAPAVTVSMPNAVPQVALPLPLPAPMTSLMQAQGQMQGQGQVGVAQPVASPTPADAPQMPPPQLPVQPVVRASAGPAGGTIPVASTPPAASPVPSPQPMLATGSVAMPASPQAQPVATSTMTQPAALPLQPGAGAVVSTPAATQVVPPNLSQALPGPGQPAAQVALPVAPPATPGAAVVTPSSPSGPQPGAPATPATPVAGAPITVATTPAATAVPAPAVTPAAAQPQPALLMAAPLNAAPPQPLPTRASHYPLQVPQVESSVVARQLPLAAAPVVPSRAVPQPLNLADPAQAAARQDTVAPLLARLAAIVTAAAPTLPRPLLEVAQRLLASRVDLNRAVPDGKALETAVMRAGVLLAPLTRQTPGDSRTALLALRSGLVGLLGSDGTAPVAPVERPAPPIRGEPPRAPPPQPAVPGGAADAGSEVQTLLGQTDAALSRLKLLQSASQPAIDARPDAATPRNELRFEIPMLLGTQTGVMQLLVERDGKHKREQRRRGWSMRFAMNFSETGEVGADIAMLGRSASISIWAADPEIADALDAMLPELGPAIQRHGLELTALRVRRGTPRSTSAAPGQLLDHAR